MPKPNRFIRAEDNTTANQFKHKRFIYRIDGQPQSALFKLPFELREQIYRFVLPRSYRKSTGTRRDQLGFEEEWGRTQYNGDRQWHEYEQFPLCLWTRGDMVVLRLCRRIANEAAPLFYRKNMFDMSVHGEEPELRIAYFPWPLPSSRCMFPNMTTYGGIRWSKGTKRITSMKRDHVRLIRSWSVMIHTHYAAHGKDWRAAAEETAEAWEDQRMVWMERHIEPQLNLQRLARAWLKRYCAGLSGKRQVYRERVMQGLQNWIGMLEDSEDHVRQLSVAFEAYPDYKGIGWMTDVKLVQGVRQQLPEWLFDKVCTVVGQVDEDELEAWEVD